MRRIAFIGFTFLFIGNMAFAQFVPIDYPGIASGTRVTGISGSTAVGFYRDGTVNHGYTYDNGNYVSFDDPAASLSVPGGGTYAMGIDGGNIVGSYVGGDGITHGFIYNGSNYITLIDPSSPSTGPLANNTNVSGISGGNLDGYYEDSNGIAHGFFYDITQNSYTNFDDPSSITGTFPTGISGNVIVGSYVIGPNQGGNFIYNITTSIFSTLPLLDNTVVSPNGISGGNIVGEFVSGTNHTSGFLYDGNNYTPYNVGTNSTSLVGLSGNYFVGDYLDSNGQFHGFLTTQIPEPATWALFTGGLAMALAAFRKLRRQ